MDILIKNMEMPTNCFACTFSVLDDYGILVCTRLRKECTRSEVRSDCPLVEVEERNMVVDDGNGFANARKVYVEASDGSC